MSFDATDIQHPVAIAVGSDDRVLVLDNEGAVFATRFATGVFETPTRLPLLRPLDFPVDMSVVGRDLFLAGREGVVILGYPDTMAEPRAEAFFETIRYIAPIAEGVLISSFGTNGARLAGTASLRDSWAIAAGIDALGGGTLRAPPLLNTCAVDSFVVSNRGDDSFVLIKRPDRSKRYSVPRFAAAAGAAGQPVDVLKTGTRRAEVIGALACAPPLITAALRVPWLTLVFVNTSSGTTTLFANDVQVPGYQTADVTLSRDLSTAYVLYTSNESTGGVLAMAVPNGIVAPTTADALRDK